MRKTTMMASVALAVATTLAGCARADGTADDVDRVRAGTLAPGGPVPAPTGSTVLRVATAADGEVAAFDLDTLERLPLVRTRIDDPWLHHPVTYTGVLLSDVLDAAGVTSGTTVHIVALDDYEVDLSRRTVLNEPIIVATAAGGHRMSVAQKGPTRIVFPRGVRIADDHDLWIWSLRQIEVR